MKKIFYPLLFLSHILFAAGSVGEDNNAFATDLYQETHEKDKNFVFSPYSIFSNLSLLYTGSAGDTEEEFQKVLHIQTEQNRFLETFTRHFEHLTKDQGESGYSLSIANALFPHKGTHFLPSFLKTAETNFDAKLQPLDYAQPASALRTINSWVSDKTMGKIPELLTEKEISDSARLVVVNAVYFQGEWVYPFEKRMTRDALFTTASGEKQSTPMMRQLKHCPYYEDEEVQAVALPFKRKDTTQPFLECLIVLPKKDELLGIDTKKVENILYNMDPKLIHLSIPKFTFSKRVNLNEPLRKIGLNEAFTYQANFSKINGMRDLYLNSVVHETFFSFHESGVTAAAATASSIWATSAPPRVEDAIEFNADHPFSFFIVDYHSRAILFMGHLAIPTEEGCDEN